MASIGVGGVLFEHDSKKTSEQPDLLMLVLVTQPRALIDSSPLTPFSFHHSAMFILHSLCVPAAWCWDRAGFELGPRSGPFYLLDLKSSLGPYGH